MYNIGGFGTSITIVALQSFPIGFNVSQFADDTDPINARDYEPTGFELLFDGSVYTFEKASALEVSISVIPGSDDDINLKILLQARKSSLGLPLPDVTSMLITYPDGGRIGLTLGSIFAGPLVDSILATGRKKSNTYRFVFGGFAGAQSGKELVATGVREVLSILQ